MDPNANLKEQRELAGEILACSSLAVSPDDMYAIAERLAELVQVLDEWIKSGGFLPREWKNKIPRVE